MSYNSLLLDWSWLLSIFNTEIDYFFKSVHLILIDCLDCAYQSNIDNPLFDDYFFSLFWNIVLDLHYVWLVVNFVNKSDDHHWTVLSVWYGWNAIKTFLLEHLSHNFEGVFFLWLVFLFCHKVCEFDILCFELEIENSGLISRVNMSIYNWLFGSIFCNVLNLHLIFITKIENFFISII